ncbi:MAG: hypothetical protein L3K04_05730 [Thermoplasmata archaeon]|nr:hypothetical protein [Thermoplasmata archaeon]
MGEVPIPPAGVEVGSTSPTRLGRALLPCEVCGRETEHRVLRLRASRGGAHLSGIARCTNCESTHAFDQRIARPVSVPAIFADGPRSERQLLHLAEATELTVGEAAPWLGEDLEIRRIDLPGGRQVRHARAREVGTLWLRHRDLNHVRVSLIEGRRTVALRIDGRVAGRFEVGDTLTVGGERLRIHAIRARSQTWEERGIGFAPAEVDRLYVRRSEGPRPRRDVATPPRSVLPRRPSRISAMRQGSPRVRSAGRRIVRRN